MREEYKEDFSLFKIKDIQRTYLKCIDTGAQSSKHKQEAVKLRSFVSISSEYPCSWWQDTFIHIPIELTQDGNCRYTDILPVIKCNCCNNFLHYFVGWVPHREEEISLFFNLIHCHWKTQTEDTLYLFLYEFCMWKIKWKVTPPLHFSPDFLLILFSHISLSNLHGLYQILEMTGRKSCYHYLVDFTELFPLYLIT